MEVENFIIMSLPAAGRSKSTLR